MLRYYLMAIVLGTLTIIGVNTALSPILHNLSFLYILAAVVINVVSVFLLDALIAYVIRKLPAKHFCPYNKFYKVYGFERKLYEKLGIKRWKDKIPEMGKILCNFGKSKVANINDNTYLYKFLTETCYAETMHFWSAVLGYGIIFLYPLKYMLLFGIPVASVNAVLQLLPVMVQRYTRPKLMKIFQHNLKRLESASIISHVN